MCVYMLEMILPLMCVMNLPLTSLKVSGLIFFFPKTKPILIGCIYKPPDQKNFNDILNRTLSSCVTQETYILGDFNYDLKVSPSTDHKVKKYLHTLSSNGFEQILLRTSPELVAILLAKEPKPSLIMFFVMIPVKSVKVGSFLLA